MKPVTPWDALFRAPVDAADAELAAELEAQHRQNAETVNLIASESYAPRSTLECEASALINCNSSGYPPRRALGGSAIIDRIEQLAVRRACELFGAEHANVQALSSTIANAAVVRALVPRGGRILSFGPSAGGHMSHGGRTHLSGQDYEVRHFGTVGPDDAVDYAGARSLAEAFQPHLVIAGSSAYPSVLDFDQLRAVADRAGALLVADVAHVAGLIVAGLIPNPVPACDVVTTSTHKTLCGPRTGGLVLCRQRFAQAIDDAISPGLQAAPGAHIIAARAVLFRLVAQPEFRALMRAVVDNAKVLAHRLSSSGLRLRTGGTETHMVVVDLACGPEDGVAVVRRLHEHGILANAIGRRDAAGVPCTQLRVGSNAMTIRGADGEAFGHIGEALAVLLGEAPGSAPNGAVRERLREIAHAFPVPVQ